MGSAATRLLEWGLTYLAHSTLLIAGVIVWLRFVRVRSNAVRETLWTVALFGGIATATMQATRGVVPWTGALDLSLLRAAGAGHSVERVRDVGADPAVALLESIGLAPADGPRGDAVQAHGGVRPSVPRSSARSTPPGPRTAVESAFTLPALAPACFGVGLALLLLLALRTWRSLRGRRVIVDGPLRIRLDRLLAGAGVERPVRLTTSESVVSPVALGWRRWEICVPGRVLCDLTGNQQDAMFAHELAHLLRNDPIRLFLARFVEIVLFVQPLNRVARRRLFEVIESRCDAFAIQRQGQGLALAECLAEVATWITEGVRPANAVAMAEAGSPLGQRIRRLLEETEALEDERRRRAVAPMAALLLPAVCLIAPALTVAAAERDVRPDVVERLEPPIAAADVRNAGAGEGHDPAPAARRRSALVDSAGRLEAEIDLFVAEIAAARRALPGTLRDTNLGRSLADLERRATALNQRRELIAEAKDRLLRGRGLDRSQRDDQWTSPWSDQR